MKGNKRQEMDLRNCGRDCKICRTNVTPHETGQRRHRPSVSLPLRLARAIHWHQGSIFRIISYQRVEPQPQPRRPQSPDRVKPLKQIFCTLCSTVGKTLVNIRHHFRLESGRTLCPLLSNFFWLFFAIAYMTPAKKPTPIAETDPIVIASPKNNIPDAATGSLFSAPIMLRSSVSHSTLSTIQDTDLYVVLLVVRTHQAVVYDIPTAAAPENAIANRSKYRVSSGLDESVRLLACRMGLEAARCAYKLRVRFTARQSSKMIENTTSTGIDSKLL